MRGSRSKKLRKAGVRSGPAPRPELDPDGAEAQAIAALREAVKLPWERRRFARPLEPSSQAQERARAKRERRRARNLAR